MAHVTWLSPLEVGRLEGYALSVYMRLEVTDKLVGDRYDVAPTQLTERIADEVAAPLSYVMDMAGALGLTTEDQVDDFIASDSSDNFGAWLKANRHKVDATRRRLQELVGKFSCYG